MTRPVNAMLTRGYLECPTGCAPAWCASRGLYVPKKDTNYVLWNRLNQVTNPARLDESETANG
jgi:hypothetical protein